MPRTTSAKKALRVSGRRRERNLKKLGDMKNVLKRYKKLIAESKKDEAEKELRFVYKKLDKLAKTNLIKKGRADRMKSRLAKKLVK